MSRVLLTGGSGFIATHILSDLLERGHSVVTTVRSEEKAANIRNAYPNVPTSKLDFAIVKDIAQEGAFDEAVKSDPPFDAVIHTASPFHYNVGSSKELLDPAIIGTTGILKAVKASAPSVKRIVITSSFAAILATAKGNAPGHTYSESDWNPVTLDEAMKDFNAGYRGSKTFAERAAWDFVDKEKPNFTIATMCPPLVFGPVKHHLSSLDSLNTSNTRVRDLLQGKWLKEVPATGTFVYVDVRDLSLAHVKAVELPTAGGLRYFVTAGHFSNRELVAVVRKRFPQLKSKLPSEDVKGGDYPEEGVYKLDNERVQKTLGIKFRTFEDTIADTAQSLLDAGA